MSVANSSVASLTKRTENSSQGQKSVHSRSRGSLSNSKSERTIPDFNVIHANYSKALVRGRHPNSFPKQSELWYHYRSSSDRVKKVAFGYDLWEVVTDQEEGFRSGTAVSDSKAEDELKNDIPAPPAATAHPNAIQMRTINGVQIDMKGQVPMHYGMVFIMMNMMDEVLCVNKWDEVKCKPIQNIDPTDRICFKVLHLLDPTNPGVLKFGSPLWLQLMDSSLSDGEAAWQNSHVLAAKPYAPPEMGSMELDRVWGQSGSIRDKDKDKEKDKPGSAETSLFPKIGQSSKFQSTKLPTTPNKPQASAKADASTKPKSPLPSNENKADKPVEGETTDGKVDAENAEEEEGIDSPIPTGSFAGDRGSSIDYEQLAAIIGDLQPVRVVDVKRESDAVMTGPRNHTKTAQYMGQWVGRLATRSKLKTDVIQTQTPIYLEQDLYCLATSHGTGFKPWPKSSSEIEYREASFPKLVHMHTESARPTTFESMNRMMGLVKTTNRSDRLVGGSSTSSVTSVGGHNATSSTGRVHTASTSMISNDISAKPAHRDIGEYGCVRKVSIRGPPYKSLVDRRCVWKFCQVDTQGDIQSLSVKDQITQRLMNRARVELRKSEQNRKGICIHKGYEYRGQPLTRGEGFTRTLRAIILQNTHNREYADMEDRRAKEKHLRRYFSNMIFGDEDDTYDYNEDDADDDDGEMGNEDEHTIVSQLSDDHFSPYKEKATGSETWDEPIIKNIIFGPKDRNENRGDSRSGRHKNDKKRSKKRKKKHASFGSLGGTQRSDDGEGDDNSINTSAAASLLEQAFHVEKFVPQYLPKKPLAYTAPVYDQQGSHYASTKDGLSMRKNSGAHYGHDGAKAHSPDEVFSDSPVDFASALSRELDDISHHRTGDARRFSHQNDSKPVSQIFSQPHHVPIHIPAHPLHHTGGGVLHHQGSQPLQPAHMISSNNSRAGEESINSQHKEVKYSRDGTRLLALDNHIDLFQSDGERVVTIHDMMDYITSKAADEVKRGDHSDNASASLIGSPNSLNSSTVLPNNANTRLGGRLTSRFGNLSLLAASSNIQNGNPLENVAAVEAAINLQNASISSKIEKLKLQDDSLKEVLKHRDAMDQYRKLTQLFQDINSSSER